MQETINHFTQKDRDSISRLEFKQERLIDDLHDLKNAFINSDHERRLREVEKQVDDFQLVKKIVYVFIGMILIAFVGALIALIIK